VASAKVFIVHLWTGDDAAPCGFRASVRCAGSDESAWVTDLAALVRYFDQQAALRRTSERQPPQGSKRRCYPNRRERETRSSRTDEPSNIRDKGAKDDPE
jgi:hypothetical protein